ncbi:MAG: helix-turn-helix domain-containing protein, partial [Salinisphaera sp.]|nr:helix-turn-helix domain-containing protein [Salinisphaera sp.]
MTAADLKSWRSRLGLSQRAAAEALGVSARMSQYYEAGEMVIPNTVALACAAVGGGPPPGGA